MRLTKNKILSLVKQNLQEMAMDFEGPERPNPDIERDLQRGNTPLSIVPTPETNRADQNFMELLASERYQEVISKVRTMTNYHGPITGTNTGPLTTMMMQAHFRIMELESAHKEELQKLAEEVVAKEMGLPENYKDDIKFIVKLKTPNNKGFNMGGQISPAKKEAPEVGDANQIPDEEFANITPENQDVEVELFNDLQNVDTTQELEESKYRLIKAIIQGSSKKGHWMYQLLNDRIVEITGSEELFNLYGVMMSVNDLNYWQFPSGTLEMSMASSIAGRVDIVRPTQGDEDMPDMEGGGDEEDEEDFDTDLNKERENEIDPTKTNIFVTGVNLPVLIHECMKGLMKMFATQGQPEKEMYKNVRESQELMKYEIWDLRIGPSIWRRLYQTFPEEVLEDNNRELQNFIMTVIFRLPAKKFLVLMKEVMGKTERGQRLVSLIYQSIVKMLNDEEYEEAVQNYENQLTDISDNTNDDQLLNDLNDIFGDKGIRLSKDDLNDEDDESAEDFLNRFR
jgi:hypothetical protein